MDSVSNAQLVGPPQVVSLIAEGVFKRNPGLRVCLQEVGFNWIHAPDVAFRQGLEVALARSAVGDRPSLGVHRPELSGDYLAVAHPELGLLR